MGGPLPMNAKFLKNWIFFLAALLFSVSVLAKGGVPLENIGVTELPGEARHTLRLIKQGGPFPYAKDGTVFHNYERVLPKQKRGYYREFTVKTSGVRHRGAHRRIGMFDEARERRRGQHEQRETERLQHVFGPVSPQPLGHRRHVRPPDAGTFRAPRE